MEMETPAEAITRWFRKPGPTQATIRWLALIPGAICIFLVSQLLLLVALSLVARSGDTVIAWWAMNMVNAAFVPVVIIKYGTRIAPSFHRHTSVVLAVVAVCLVGFSRLAFELSHHQQNEWRFVWLACAAVLCGASVLSGIRSVNRKVLRRDGSGAEIEAV